MTLPPPPPPLGGPPPPPPPPLPRRKPVNGPVAVITAIGMFIGGLVLLAGLVITALIGFARDDDGFFSAGVSGTSTTGYAFTTEDLDLGTEDWAPSSTIAKVRVTATSDSGKPVFVGIAHSEDIDDYLGDVGRSQILKIENGDPVFRDQEGGKPTGPPEDQDFWLAQSQGTGDQYAELDLESGSYSAVVMNADASRKVNADLRFGFKLGWLGSIGWGAIGVGLFLLIPSFIFFIRAVRTPRVPG